MSIETVADTARARADRYAAMSIILKRRLGPDLTEARKERGMSAAQVAEATGLARSTIWRIEAGRDVRMFCLLAVMDWMAKP